MRRPQFPGKRHLGNTNNKEVHDLDKEDASPNGCQVNEIIRANHAATFKPDTLAEAHNQGYDNCAKCLSGSIR